VIGDLVTGKSFQARCEAPTPSNFDSSEFPKGFRASTDSTKVLGVKGAKRGLRFPKWQVTCNGDCFQSFQSCSICLAATIPGPFSLNITHEFGILSVVRV
jgi:hypothetical protein